MSKGEITAQKAGVIHRTLAHVEWVDARAIEAAVLPAAGDLSYRRLENRLKKQVATLNPEKAADLAVAARLERRVTMEPAEHDMAYLNLYGPAEDILTIYAYADKAARVPRPAGQNDTRRIGNRRFDAIANLCVQAIAGELPGIDTRLVAEHREHRAAVQVTIATHDVARVG